MSSVKWYYWVVRALIWKYLCSGGGVGRIVVNKIKDYDNVAIV